MNFSIFRKNNTFRQLELQSRKIKQADGAAADKIIPCIPPTQSPFRKTMDYLELIAPVYHRILKISPNKYRFEEITEYCLYPVSEASQNWKLDCRLL
jgi:hypothetical protein